MAQIVLEGRGDMRSPISELQKTQQQVVRLEEKLKGTAATSRQTSQSAVQGLGAWGGQLRSLTLQYVGVRGAISGINAILDHQQQIGENAASKLAGVAESQIDLVEAMTGRSPEEMNRVAQAMDRMAAAGRKMKDVGQVLGGIVGMVPRQQVDRGIAAAETGLALFQTNATKATEFAKAMIQVSSAFKLGLDDAAGYVLAQQRLGASLSEIGPTSEKAARDLDLFAQRAGTTRQAILQRLAQDASAQRRFADVSGEEELKRVRGIMPGRRDPRGQAVITRAEAGMLGKELAGEIARRDTDAAKSLRARQRAEGEPGEAVRASLRADDLMNTLTKQMEEAAANRGEGYFDAFARRQTVRFRSLTPEPTGALLGLAMEQARKAQEAGFAEEAEKLRATIRDLIQALKAEGGFRGEQAARVRMPPSSPAANVNQHIDTKRP